MRSRPAVPAALLWLVAVAAPAQQPAGRDVPASLRELAAGLGPLAEAATLQAPAVDAPSLAAAASVSSASTGHEIAPFRFAEPFAVDASPANLGEWRTSVDGGTEVWRLRIVSEGAVSLNLGFTRYRMPPGGSLYVYTPGFAEVLGPFTEADNESHGELWTPILAGSEAEILVSVPARSQAELELELGSVNRGFQAPEDAVSASHGSCDPDVACSQADPYRDQVRSVGWFSALGQTLCSGVLLDNTDADGKLYFLTARSCLHWWLDSQEKTRAQIAASVVVYWNDEASTCGGSTPRFNPRHSQSGAAYLAEAPNSGGDFLLLRLDDPPDPAHDLYLAGWDLGLPDSGPVAGIHHSGNVTRDPRQHFKSIALANGFRPTRRAQKQRAADGGFLMVDWDQGGSEFGSWGSPLFNAEKRVIGHLAEGRFGSCDTNRPYRRVWYGRFDGIWDAVDNWLDPDDTDVAFVAGRNASVMVSPLRLKVLEDGSATYTVVPTSEPDENEDDLVITLSVPTGTDVSASPSSLTFTTDNWETAQTVTVSAADDTDNLRDDPVSIGHGAAGGGYDSASVDDVVAVIGENDPGVEISESALSIDECESTSYTVTLVSAPTAEAVLSVSVPANGPVSVSPSSLTFTTDDWEAARTVTVNSVVDLNSDQSPPARISHSGSGGGYGAVSIPVVSVTVREPAVVGVSGQPALLSVDECASESYAVKPTSAPTAEVVVSVMSPAHSPFSVAPRSMTFTPENWETARPVVVTLPEGSDLAAPSVELFHDISGCGFARYTLIPGVPVRIGGRRSVDVKLRPTSLSVDEDGSASYTVALTSAPAANAVVSVTTPVLDHVRHIRASASSLTFTTDNWNTPQAVRVSARDDPDAAPLPTMDISHSVSGCGFATARGPNLPVTVRENDVAGVTVRPRSLTVPEGGTASYTVVLTSQPTTTNMRVSVDVPDGVDVSVDRSSLPWVWNWNRERTVTVTAAEDADPDPDAPVVISHRARGADYGSVSVPSVTVMIVENDASALAAVDASASEGSGELSFEVTISRAGTSDVLVDYATSDGTARAGSDYTSVSGTLTFPQGTTTSRTIRVPLRDDAADEPEEETFTLTLSNARNGHLAGGASRLLVTGTIEDDDDPAVTASFGSARYSVTEGSSVRVVVRLDKDPERTVELPLLAAPGSGVIAGEYAGVPGSVTFGAGDSETDFLVTAAADGEEEGVEEVALTFGSSLPARVTAGAGTVLAIRDAGGGSLSPPGGPGGAPPPPSDEDEDGGGGLTPPRASIRTDAECADGLCRARTGAPVRFEDASAGSVRRRSWDFGGGSSRSASVNWSWSEPGFHEVTLRVSGGGRESTASLVFLVEASEPAGTCVAAAGTLCLRDSRFSVEVEWWTASGERGAGRVVRRGTNDSGLFWFFGGGNWEMLIKVLDGCALNGHVWVYAALTTDLGYRIAVTDTVTGALREYRNEPGSPAPAVTDATAFPGACPAKRL